MSYMVSWVTTERGLDAGDFAMVAYGGAGPLHAAMIARELRIGKVIIPYAPGHFSAYGMLFADLRRDLVNTWFKPFADTRFAEMEALYGAMEKQGAEDLARGRHMTADAVVQRGADMRYVGQEHAVTVDIPLELFERQDRDGIKKHFDAVHETRYGYYIADEKAEIVSLRSATIGLMVSRSARRSPKAARSPRPRLAARDRFISPAPARSRRRPMTAAALPPAIASRARR